MKLSIDGKQFHHLRFVVRENFSDNNPGPLFQIGTPLSENKGLETRI